MKPYVLWICLVLMVLGLTGCSQDIDLYMRGNERWKIVSEFTYSSRQADVLESLVSVLGAEPGVYLSVDASEMSADVVEAVLNELVALYSQEEIQAEWRELREVNDEHTYRFVLEATGYDKLERVLPGELIEVREDSEGNVRLEVNIGMLNPYSASVFQQDVTVHARHIVDSNAPLQRGGSATWHNPGSFWVSMKVGGVGVGDVLVGLALVAVIASAVWFFLLR
jgi:hypothetical protein